MLRKILWMCMLIIVINSAFASTLDVRLNSYDFASGRAGIEIQNLGPGTVTDVKLSIDGISVGIVLNGINANSAKELSQSIPSGEHEISVESGDGSKITKRILFPVNPEKQAGALQEKINTKTLSSREQALKEEKERQKQRLEVQEKRKQMIKELQEKKEAEKSDIKDGLGESIQEGIDEPGFFEDPIVKTYVIIVSIALMIIIIVLFYEFRLKR